MVSCLRQPAVCCTVAQGGKGDEVRHDEMVRGALCHHGTLRRQLRLRRLRRGQRRSAVGAVS